jgi:hypothetical protein
MREAYGAITIWKAVGYKRRERREIEVETIAKGSLKGKDQWEE